LFFFLVRAAYLREHTHQIIKAQSCIRRHLARKSLEKLKEEQILSQKKLAAVIKAQALVRMRLARKRYLDTLEDLKGKEDQAKKIQATWRMVGARRRYVGRLQQLKENEKVFVKVSNNLCPTLSSFIQCNCIVVFCFVFLLTVFFFFLVVHFSAPSSLPC
jgi:hypothetical protein